MTDCVVYYNTDRPTQVKIGIYVISFYSINEQTMVCWKLYLVNLSYII